MDMVTFLKIFKTFLFLGISTIIISFTSLSDARAAGADARHKQIVKCVENNYPARTYMTNHLLPWPNTPWVKMDCKKKDKIRVGMPWVLNDEEAPWYNAIEKGFYSDVCLDVELVGGGPGKNHVMTLAGGAVDIAVSAAGSRVFSLVYSKTPAKVVAIGAFLKHMPYVWLGLDHDTPKNQRSNKKLKPRDFIGKRIGIQGGDDYLFDYMANKHNIPKDKVEIMAGGFTPDPVLVGSMDYIGAWIVNQPRLLEEKGYMNWVAFPFSDWGLDGYSDVSVARQETVDNNPDMLKRYLAATHQGLKFLLENPDESAEIAVKYGVDAQLTKKQALRRFELQEALVSDGPNEILMEMKDERWNDTLANFIEYKQIELKNCK